MAFVDASEKKALAATCGEGQSHGPEPAPMSASPARRDAIQRA
jgi:hypothetical protein